MKNARFAIALLVLLLAASLALSACGSSGSGSASGGETAAGGPAGGEPISGGKFVIGEEAEITELDPAPALFDNAWRLDDYVYETLVTTDGKSKVLPELATKWEQKSPTDWVFDLRKGASFSNGKPVTAKDVVGSLERLIDPELGAFWAVEMGPIKSIKALDGSTVEIQLESPYQPLLYALSHTPASILPMEELEAGSFDPAKELLGSGPFEVAKHVADQYWLLERNPHYKGPDTPKLAEIEIKAIPDEAARTAALRSGQIDAALYENPFASETLAGVPAAEVTTVEQPNYDVFEVNEVNPSSPFTDKKVRQAVAYAIDRESINELVGAGLGNASGITPYGLSESCNPEGLPTYERSTEKAEELLAEAGKSNFEFTLLAYNSNPTLKSVAEVLQQSLSEAGIKVNIETPDIGKWSEDLYSHDPSTFDASLDVYAGWSDPTMVIQYWNPKQFGINKGYQDNVPALNEAIEKSVELEPGSERAATLETVCTLAAEDGGVVPLVTNTETVAVRNDLVAAKIPAFESYALFFRNYPEYTLLAK